MRLRRVSTSPSGRRRLRTRASSLKWAATAPFVLFFLFSPPLPADPSSSSQVWRRRQVKLRGSTLVPYSEVTKRSHVEINLALVTSIEDLNVQTMPTPGSNRSFQRTDEDDDVFARMDHSFRLVFKDGNKIDFFADTEESKTRWLEELNGVVGKAENKKTAPEWAVAVRKLPVPTPKAA